MGLEALVTVIVVGVIVAALAIYLIIIVFILRKVIFNLGTILIGVNSIASQAEPLREVMGGIVSEIDSIERTLASLAPDEDAEAQEDGQARRRSRR